MTKRDFVKTGISWLDVKLGTRMLFKNPGMTLVGGMGMAVAIAIGAGFFNGTAAMSSTRLPLDDGHRIVGIDVWDARINSQEPRILHDYAAWRTELRTVRELGAFRDVPRNLIVPGQQAEQVVVAEMTASGFTVARVRPVLGRTLVEEDEREGAPPVIVIGQEVWRRRFASDPAIVGKEVRLGNAVHTVVGVMPEDFAWPVDHRFWVPLRLDPADYARGAGPEIQVFGRLAPGASLHEARAELETLGRRTAAALPATHQHLRPRVLPYTQANGPLDDVSMAELQALRLLMSLLLVVVCANVAILVYARTATRMGEIAVRSALGASRRRIVTQLFVEALVLSSLAAAVGLVIARISLDQLLTQLPAPGGGDNPFWLDFGLSASTIAYTAVLVVAAAVIVGVIPAMQATGRRLQSGLRQLGGGTGMRLGKTWTALIVLQVAIAVAILPMALYNAWDWMRYGLSEPGFAADEFLVAQVGMDSETPTSAQAETYEAEFQARYASRLGELEGRLRPETAVGGVAFSLHTPGSASTRLVRAEGVGTARDARGGQAGGEGPDEHEVFTTRVDDLFFQTFGVPVLAGRTFLATELDTASRAVVVNQSFVQTVLGGGSVLGRRVRYRGSASDEAPKWYEVVGVVSDFPGQKMPMLPAARIYHPLAPGENYPLSVVIRVQGTTPAAFVGRLRDVATSVDPALRMEDARSMAEVMREPQALVRVTTLGIGLVTLTVLLLSAAGIDALMSFTVTQRRREIGIRTALGAHPRRILASIFSRAARQLGMGVVVGLLAAALMVKNAGGMMGSQGYLLLPAVALLMIGVGLLAALGPARRGLRIQPMEALRDE